jgi:hypothetical protein
VALKLARTRIAARRGVAQREAGLEAVAFAHQRRQAGSICRSCDTRTLALPLPKRSGPAHRPPPPGGSW